MKQIMVVLGMLVSLGIANAQSDTLYMAPNFKLVNLNGDSVQLSDFRGKVVYIDFWASWCGPCIQEMKHSRKLYSKFKDNPDVVFIYISIDKVEANWRAAVEKHQIVGVHLHAPDTRGVGRKTGYKVQFTPRYVLINKEGRLVEYDASRPSDRHTDEAIEKLLK